MSTATILKKTDVVWEREVEDLFREHYKFMYRAAYAVLGRRADAEDVIQTLFLKFVQHELRSEVRKDPKGYLHRAAVHESLKVIRSRNRRNETDGVEELEIPEPRAGWVNDNVRNKLRDTFAELQPNTVEILILHYEHGYSDAEIANMRGQSRGKIAMILNRSRTQLQELMTNSNTGKHDETQRDKH
jgi:RNA polymerase sigma-70 factor (ECF subfamily)